MSLIVPSRRGFIKGLGALFAAPAIVRFASLMPVKAITPGIVVGYPFISLDEYARRIIAAMVRHLESQYDEQFALPGTKIGTTLRIRMPDQWNS